MTDAIIWETDQSLQQLHPDRIVLVAEEGSVRADALHEQFAGSGLTLPTGNWVERALLFYPAPERNDDEKGSGLREPPAARNRVTRQRPIIAVRHDAPRLRNARSHAKL